MDKITKKYIFEQKLKGEPVKIPWSNHPWLEEIRNFDILVEYGILEGAGRGRFIVRYPVMMHGSYGIIPEEDRDDKWTNLPVGAQITNPGDRWET